ncbi:SPFH domain / Band 7 family protein [Lentzea xinjiangensis]|uniref:SPFH domain / Band 7 family protein n=1 Tax=Lentzea xinjiangensis TaxID=402600 RepID=A0A1H9MHK9_9PSEU|nr:SPFH domain-containing protein [Lentzea xinjiangensis]SER23021.1 SPFH domain / Band 7 family protein [Lentzea xinjiangensis]
MNQPHQRPAAASLITKLEPSRSDLFRDRPMPGGERATVYLDRKGGLYQSDRPLTAGEIAINKPRTVYLVDTAVHPFTLALDLPAQEDAFPFHAEVSARWRVGDPCEAVRTSLSDAGQVLAPYLKQTLREISTSYAIEERPAAERAMIRYFSDQGPLPLPQGVLLVHCSVSLSLDGPALEELRKRKQHEWNAKEWERQNTTIHRNAALEEAQETNRHARERAEAEHQLRLTKRRMDFYGQALEGGQEVLIALQLASSPGEVNNVLALLMQRDQMDFETAKELLSSLLENRLVNHSDVQGIMSQASTVIASQLSRASVGLPSGGIPIAAPPPPPRPAAVPDSTASAPITAEILLDPPPYYGDDDDDD